MSEHAVTVLISRNVKPGCEADFERVIEQLVGAAAKFDGYLGAQLVHPGDDPDAEDVVYHVVLAFDSQVHLDAGHDSPERAKGTAATMTLIERLTSSRQLSGMGHHVTSR
jgi:uncharacterized protein